MNNGAITKTTFKEYRSLEPFYTGGEIVANRTGKFLASTVDDEDCLLVDASTATPLVRIDGDGEAITNLALTPNADYLIVSSRSLSMRVFHLTHIGSNTITAELVRSLKPHTTPVVASTIDPTGTLLVTGGADGIVKVWDIRGGYCSHTFSGHGGVITALEVFETTSLTRSNSKKRKIQGTQTDESAVKALFLASSSEDGRIKVHNLNTKQNVATLDSHVSVVKALRFCAEQQTLISASRDRTIVIWDVRTWSLVRVIPTSEEIEAADVILGGNYVYAGGEQGRLRVWSTSTGKEVQTGLKAGLETEAVVSIFPMQHQRVLVARSNQVLELISYEGLEQNKEAPIRTVKIFSGNLDEIIDMSSLSGSLLAVADNTESVKIISSNTIKEIEFGTNIATLEGHSDVVLSMDTDASGTWLATGSKDNTARLWHIDSRSSRHNCVASFAGHTASVGAISLSKSSTKSGNPPLFMITGSEDKTVKRWDTSKLGLSGDVKAEPQAVAKALFTRVAHEKDINAIDVSPIAPLFASASQDRTIKIWSTENGSTTAVLRGHKRGVWSVRFSPAGTPALNPAEGGSSGNRGLLVSGSGDNTVKVWSLNTYACLLTFEGHQNSVLKVIWLPPPPLSEETDERQRQRKTQPMIASASSDTLIKLWSPYAPADSDPLLTTLDGHTDRVWSLASPFAQSSDSKSSLPYTLVSGAADAKICFWTDTTELTASETSKAVTERIEQDQLLQNYILARNYKEVITLSLALNHPGRLLRVFEDVVNLPINEREEGTFMGVKAVDDVLASLNKEQIFKLLERVRDWNTNARTSTVAQKILNCLLKSYPQSMWIDMAKDKTILRLARSGRAINTSAANASGGNGMKDLFRALEAYTERHYKRTEELIDESYLLEYTLREMDEVTGTSAAVVNGTHNKSEDMIMI